MKIFRLTYTLDKEEINVNIINAHDLRVAIKKAEDFIFQEHNTPLSTIKGFSLLELE